jgi:DNA-binding beta-propeller fold protein YncE
VNSIISTCRARGFSLFIMSWLISWLLVGFCSSTVYADGGAPQLAYVAGTAQGISVIDIAQRRVIGTIAHAGRTQTILLSPDGQLLYVTQPLLGRVAVIEARTGKIRCTATLPGQPSLLALSLDATVLYVAGQGDTNVRAIEPATCTILHVFATHEPVYGMAVTASTAADATPSTPNQLWVTGSTSLTIFDTQGHLLGSLPLADGPQNICIPGGFTAYVTTRQGTVLAIDLNTRQVFRTLLTGGQFGPMDYDANTGEVYVPDRRHNQLDVLAPVTVGSSVFPQEPAHVLYLGHAPQAVAITSDGQLGFVALANGSVAMLDIPQRRIVTSIAVGGTPHFIITGLYPPSDNPQATSSQPVTTSSAISVSNVALIVSILLAAMLLLTAVFWFLRGRRYD